ncbi:MAG TPA: OmpA family protein [Rhodanobacteraceae bacterium]|nr:OmpA family protein [Rhodanobacteraceae bacterium]
MRRRARTPEPETSGWAIPYGDFLTLMLAVFIAMYAVSQVNTAKYHALAQSLGHAFRGAPADAPAPRAARLLLPVAPQALLPMPLAPIARVLPSRIDGARAEPAPPRATSANPQLQTISRRVAQALQPWVASGAVTIRQTPWRLAITIRTDVLFPEGAAELSALSRATLRGVAKVLAPFDNPVRIEGSTDDLPIHTARFPSNWELSASRAASVAQLFGSAGVAPARLAVVGWGQYRPIASNASAAGRARNRRVVVVVTGGDPVPPSQAGGNTRVAAAHGADAAGASATRDWRASPSPAEPEVAGAGVITGPALPAGLQTASAPRAQE